MIKLNGKEYKWRFRLEAQMLLEKRLQITAKEISAKIDEMASKGFDFKLGVEIAYCGLSLQDETMTYSKVVEILDEGTAQDIIEVYKKYNEDIVSYLAFIPSPNGVSQAQ